MGRDLQTEINILEKIIKEDGSCTWSKPSICAVCPLGKLDRYESGRYISCVEYFNIDGLTEEEADAVYKKAAEERLADLVIRSNIEED